MQPLTIVAVPIEPPLLMRKFALVGLALLAFFALVVWSTWHFWLGPRVQVETRVGPRGTFVLMRTEGGVLGVAALKRTERVTRSETLLVAGVSLGTTVSTIEVPVVYQYEIALAREWPVLISGRTCVVQTPPIALASPVAFDTAGIRMDTRNGWARLNKAENLETLQRSLSAALESNAKATANWREATEFGRKTVAEFVAKWFPDPRCRPGSGYAVKVVFPNESIEDALAGRPTPD